MSAEKGFAAMRYVPRQSGREEDGNRDKRELVFEELFH
jgi:hypothetical protein